VLHLEQGTRQISQPARKEFAQHLLMTLLCELEIHHLVHPRFSPFGGLVQAVFVRSSLHTPARNSVTSASIHSTPW
jgi:hypothetical protein